MKGKHYTGSGDGALNIVKFDDGRYGTNPIFFITPFIDCVAFRETLKFKIKSFLLSVWFDVENQLSKKVETNFTDFDSVLYTVPLLLYLLVLRSSCMLLNFGSTIHF